MTERVHKLVNDFLKMASTSGLSDEEMVTALDEISKLALSVEGGVRSRTRYPTQEPATPTVVAGRDSLLAIPFPPHPPR